ncbi:feline leukemia virus subgroup C receptor-related protein 2-like [Nasonia vitripennis]|uniref:Major facilitator superfamily (MFS) profile domain-containing protein n=1 Tax=Nasonia vitripennis TaxID=7425 RepID=A0A7M7G9C1_NASVI|nr:feline leukemia virus subgroup C receptor-related protein 2-like [Nasonia vitripennis]
MKAEKTARGEADGVTAATAEGRGIVGPVKLYKRRWLMLALFILYSTSINGQWIEYSIISNIATRYYNVSNFAIDCMAMSYMFYYVIFIFPATYLLERIGIRRTLILGSCMSCLGAWIKTFAIAPDRFYVVLIGQSIVAITQVLMLPIPGRIAAKWFGSAELSTATSVGVFGTQLGVSVSFLFPPMLVKNHESIEDIGSDLSFLSLSIAIAATANLLLVGLLFQEEPELPPSETRALQKLIGCEELSDEGFLPPMKRLFSNSSFLILCNSYGLSIGVLNAVATLLNQMFLVHFRNGEEDAGRIGLLIVVTGMVGSIVFGMILDKTHKFKETAVGVYALTFLGQIVFAAAMFLELKWMVYLAAVFLGFFMSGYLALGYEMAVEYTYPEAETLSAGVLNIANNVYGIVLVVLLSYGIDESGDVSVHVGLCLALLVGLVLTLMTKDEKRRQDARKTTGSSSVKFSDLPLMIETVKTVAA